MKNSSVFMIFILSTLCAGCVFIPLPHSTGERAPIKEEAVSFISIGTTTKEDVLLRLGEPSIVNFNEMFFLYGWERISGYFVMLGKRGGAISIGKQYFLEIEFDEKGVVKRCEIKEEGKTKWHP